MRSFEKDLNDLKNIENIRHSLDIIYRYHDEYDYRGIQVKTLASKPDRKDSWCFTFKSNDIYHPDTLIVGANQQRSRFVILFRKQCPKRTVSLAYLITSNSIQNKKSKYSDGMFTDQGIFIQRLRKLMR